MHQTLFDVLDFNLALKVINVTVFYENDENDIDFGVPENKDGLMTSARELSSYTEKSDNRFLKTRQQSCEEHIFSKVACSNQ